LARPPGSRKERTCGTSSFSFDEVLFLSKMKGEDGINVKMGIKAFDYENKEEDKYA